MRTAFDETQDPDAYGPKSTKPEDKAMSCPRCGYSTTWGVLSQFGNRCGPCFDAYRRQPLETARAMRERHARLRAMRQAAAANARAHFPTPTGEPA